MRSALHLLKRRMYLYGATYFKLWADISLRRWKPRVIAVTGSVGKTTMLHLLEMQLGNSAHYSHFANSAYGVPFDILGLRGITGSKLKWLWLALVAPFKSLYFTHQHTFYVVEIDGERPKETEFLAKWLKPEVTLWVSLGRSHAVYYDQLVAEGQFDSVDDAIADEFAWLPRMTTKLVLIDGSNPKMRAAVEDIATKVGIITRETLKRYTVQPEQTTFELRSGSFTFTYPLPEETYVQLAMLVELANYLDRKPQFDATDFHMPPGRSSFFHGIRRSKLIDSSYNAHLISMKSATRMFQAMKVPQKWLVIGDMIEQGKSEADEHKALADVLAAVDAEQYVLVGRRTKKYTLQPLQKKVGDKVVAFERPADALTFVRDTMPDGVTVLFKGSQYLEGIIKRLLANPADEQKLCRREPIHQKRRQDWGVS